MSTKAVLRASVEGDPQSYENEHVHQVYDQIASHFSATRYKPWPIIAKFMENLPPGYVGLDSGTGNGKYLSLPSERPSSVWTIGLDRSRNLLQLAQNAGGQPKEVVWGDVLGKSWRSGVFDFAISIATIHHLATKERRIQSVQFARRDLSRRLVLKHGRVLIYVWAVEQDELSKRAMPDYKNQEQQEPSSAEGYDVFVPWKRAPVSKADSPQTFNRYYHMFSKGELTELVRTAAEGLGLDVSMRARAVGATQGLEILQDGWERSNYYVEIRRWSNED
ncbi:hypothetical protein DL96DRAFT_1669007 [Flagelloscypha sp. PMI_526]|nr:hypothetical protein DL96DRAFT_1669007 [Flagelloscypha sp. PMI_526]